MTFATTGDAAVAEAPIAARGADTRALPPAFAASFKEASERRVKALYDIVAAGLSTAFDDMAAAAGEQLEVLNEVAALVGLERIDLTEKLEDEAGEALAQRIAWRSAARWTVLSLLWALAESPTRFMTSGEWAELARGHEGKRPRSRSSLPPGDEPMALSLAADALVRSPALTQGTAMDVLHTPVVISAREDHVVASAPRPLALVETDSDWSTRSVELGPGDRVLATGPLRGLSLKGPRHQADDATFVLTGKGRLDLAESTHAVGVARGSALLLEWESRE
jgi:hypothetical protein